MPPLEKRKNSDLKKKTALVGFPFGIGSDVIISWSSYSFYFFYFLWSYFRSTINCLTRACWKIWLINYCCQVACLISQVVYQNSVIGFIIYKINWTGNLFFSNVHRHDTEKQWNDKTVKKQLTAVHMAKIWSLKGVWHKIFFTSGFYNNSVSSGPLSIPHWEPFEFLWKFT